ncbi:MAG: hypothetical protein I4O36_05815 [Ralstonia pickettii]|jgi:hypothetical protein|uniref:Uncharacterized protein n=2 Tax=Ralstonia TaxID=48736 RepID=A0AAD2BNH8_9RALS|nr:MULTISPECIES: hypothetical protein [Burkholderiaceae]MBR7954534.1 hypothetical protein [Burkholderia cenocepacia]MCL6456298.1 hypothetical protein [Ralstonia pickettii]POH87861.1 hypothetical protein CJ026_013690 [Ralstonia pickettii]CAJ0787125.1 hypothetical protein R77560_01529 [Ralstonia sp. LMG 18095]CAJ0874799.1 hypothetical protein R6138_02054 [Ralstonia sp. LMG 18095]
MDTNKKREIIKGKFPCEVPIIFSGIAPGVLDFVVHCKEEDKHLFEMFAATLRFRASRGAYTRNNAYNKMRRLILSAQYKESGSFILEFEWPKEPVFLHLDEEDVLSPCDDEHFTSLEKKNLRAALESKLNINRPAAKQLKI